MHKNFRPLLVLVIAGFAAFACAAEKEGIALAIVYDTSGSMSGAVKASNGSMTPKYLIANRALTSVVNRLDQFRKNAQPTPAVEAALVTFSASKGRITLPMDDFKPELFEKWVKTFSTPSGDTPLGLAVETAARLLQGSRLSKKHVLVITDGVNSAGPDPASVIARLTKEQSKASNPVFYHFIAFDVATDVFSPLKKLGVTLVSAADEVQLTEQLDFILEEKILLEAEEPQKK